MNGVYWEKGIPPLFANEQLAQSNTSLVTIADITDDVHGSVPCNIGDATTDNPVYGIDLNSFEKTTPYKDGSVDIMAVGNLPNELPRDASRFFGEQLIKYVLSDLGKGGNPILEKATILDKGVLTKQYVYLAEYAKH
jgi:alanine dehydrogenase